MTAQPSPDPRSFEVTIPIKTVSELNAREHYMQRAKRRKREKSFVYVYVLPLRQTGITAPCAVTLTRVAPSRGLDQDNLVSSMKAAIDAIASVLGIDDRDPRVTWSYLQRRGKPREYAVDVKVVANG